MEFQSGTPITQWCKLLQVILQKISGNIKIEKQRGVLLIEAGFNFGNKLYFGSKMINGARYGASGTAWDPGSQFPRSGSHKDLL